MRRLKFTLEKEITDEQAGKLTELIKLFRPDMEDAIFSDEDLSFLVAGFVAGNVDKMLGVPRTTQGWKINK